MKHTNLSQFDLVHETDNILIYRNKIYDTSYLAINAENNEIIFDFYRRDLVSYRSGAFRNKQELNAFYEGAEYFLELLK